MKATSLRTIILLPILLIASLAFHGVSFAEPPPFYWEFINVDIDVLENGDMLVTETQKYVFTGPYTNERYRYIRLDRVDRIDSVQVFEGAKLIPVTTGVENNQLWIRWRHALHPPESHTFILSYRVLGGLHIGVDSDEVNWEAISADRPALIQRATVTVRLPDKVAGQIRSKDAWGVPALAREVDAQTVEFVSRGSLPPGKELEVEVIFPHGLLDAPQLKRFGQSGSTRLRPNIPPRWKDLSAKAYTLYQQGRYAEAAKVAKEALKVTEDTFGPGHPAVATSLTLLGQVYQAQGKPAEAEPLFKRALAIHEKALGPDHPTVGTSLNNLADVYRAQGKYAEAEPMFKRALAIYEKALGPENPEVATTLNNLAAVYLAQGKYTEAEPMFKRALAIREKALGPAHPKVAESLNNLALLYYSQGKYAEAELLYKRALAVQEKALGPEHPEVATALNNLAQLYQAQGEYAAAEPLFKRALAIAEKTLGPEHPNVATLLESMAMIYVETGRQDEGKRLWKRAKAIRSKNQ